MDKVWIKHYPKGVPAEIKKSDCTLNDLFNNVCNKYPNNRAVTSHGETITFMQLEQYVNNFASSLVELGNKKGDRIAIILPNVMQYPIAIFAILKIGAVVVNINPLYTEHEIEYILGNSGAKTVIVLNMMANKLNNLYKKEYLEHVIVSKIPDTYSCFKRYFINFALKYIKRVDISYNYQTINFRDLILDSDNANNKITTTANNSNSSNYGGDSNNVSKYNIELKASDLAFIQYTGATTGKPKGVMLSHANIVANLDQIYSWITPSMGDLSKQVAIAALPLYHIFSLTANLFAFLLSGSENVMVINPRDTKDIVKILNKTPFTIFSALDTLYSHLLNASEFVNSKFPYFKYSVAGGMPSRFSVSEEWQKITGVIFTNCYGLTEASPAVTMNEVGSAFDGSVGFPIPSTEIQIRDAITGNELPIGATGVLFIRGPQVTKGYWNNALETSAAFDQEGWFNTKDIGYINEQGKLFLNGRQSDLIIVSGFNVYPVEVEIVLDQIPGIKESAVVGNKNDNTGEIVVAFVVLSSELIITEQNIIKKCKEKLASYKVPREIHILETLPRTLVGKIDKVLLKANYLKI